MALIADLFKVTAEPLAMPDVNAPDSAPIGIDAETTAVAADAGPAGGVLDALVATVADSKIAPAQNSPAETVPTAQAIQDQLDAINAITWKPEIAPKNDAVSTDVVRGNNATAGMVKDATVKLAAVTTAEADLKKLETAVADGTVAQPEMPVSKADAPATAGGMARGAVADAAVTAAMTAINPVLGAVVGGLSLVNTARDFMNAGSLLAADKGQGSFGAPTASSQSVKLTGAEAREYRRSGNIAAQDVSPAKDTFAAQAAGYNRAPSAAPAKDEFGVVPHNDLVFGANNMRDSMDGLKGVAVEKSPALAALRGQIVDMKTALTDQREVGKDLQNVYQARAQDGVELTGDTLADAMNRGMKINTNGGPAISGMVA